MRREKQTNTSVVYVSTQKTETQIKSATLINEIKF